MQPLLDYLSHHCHKSVVGQEIADETSGCPTSSATFPYNLILFSKTISNWDNVFKTLTLLGMLNMLQRILNAFFLLQI